MTNEIELEDYIRCIPDFPKPGILFRDITPLLSSPDALGETVRRMAEPFRDREIDAILAAEARGFIFAAPLALELNARFIPLRKPGKLPGETYAHEYELEYGNDALEMHKDAVSPGDHVLLVDDLLATGGTLQACIRLAERAEAVIESSVFLIELAFLNGRQLLAPYDVHSLISYGDTD